MNFGTFILDTNIVSETQKRKPHPRIIQWLKKTESVAIPFPVIFEIEWGITNKSRTDPARAAQLRYWWDQLMKTEFEYPIMTPRVAALEARMAVEPFLKNLWLNYAKGRQRPPVQDLKIAALAVCYGMPIATLDTRDFALIDRYFPLPGVFNPAIGEWIVPYSKVGRVPHLTAA
ncbi:PIN domain-containing protein [Rhizobium sp. ZW T2_16]|uniref:PIN domain-containing protein n=1 Tax=Rhizobium sp. ZW T2_16 TaxID=3378083 RepID=UPI00385220E5